MVSCSYLNQTPRNHDCAIEETIVDSIEDFADQVRDLDDGPEFVKALNILDNSVNLGHDAIRLCKTQANRSEIVRWIGMGLSGLASVLHIIKASGVEIPDIVFSIMELSNRIIGGFDG
jgi:hypothetical protein